MTAPSEHEARLAFVAGAMVQSAIAVAQMFFQRIYPETLARGGRPFSRDRRHERRRGGGRKVLARLRHLAAPEHFRRHDR